MRHLMKLSTQKLITSPGQPYPLGANPIHNGVNFAIYIKDASAVSLCLFDEKNPAIPFKEIELDPNQNRTGDVWHVVIEKLQPNILYAFRVIPNDEKDTSYLLLDPYAKAVGSHAEWGQLSSSNLPYRPLGKIVQDSFDWEDDKPPRIPMNEMIIYEMHVRGFTIDSSSRVEHPGTFLGVIKNSPFEIFGNQCC